MARIIARILVLGIVSAMVSYGQDPGETFSTASLPQPSAARSNALNVPPVFRSTAREVNQIFTVQDGHGHPIPDLQRADFEIHDAGKQVAEVAAFRQQTETPLHIAVAIDLSGSVSTRVKYEVEVSTKFLQRVLRPGDQGWVMGFNYRSYIIQDLSRARDSLLGIHRQEPKAATAFYDALCLASTHLANAGGETNHRDVLVIISDGVDNASHSNFRDALQTVLRSGVIVLVLYTGSAASTRELRILGDMTGGQFFYTFTLGGVLRGLEKAEQAIRGQYLLAYRPPDFQPDGRFRQIDIRPLRRGLHVRCRKGYFALDVPTASPQTSK